MEIPIKLEEIINTKATLLNTTPEQIFEYMVMEYIPSTPIEKREQLHRRDTALAKFIKEYPNSGVAHAWVHGFKIGWEQFQIRKSSTIFKREE